MAFAVRNVRLGSLTLSRTFVVTPEHTALKDNLTKLIEKELNPHCPQWEAAKKFPAHKVCKILGDAGYLGISLPVEYGGMGLDISYEAVAQEAFASLNSSGASMGIGIQMIVAPALARFGSEMLKEKFLRPTIAGDYVACLGASEVGGGSDVAALKTRATREGDEWVINGSKMWTTNGAQADWMCLLANSSEGGDVHKNKSLFCVPMDTPGVTVSRVINKLGMHASDTCEITFEDVRIPHDYIIGQQGKGFIYQMMLFQNERIFIAGGTIAALDRCIEETIEYTSQRVAFGKSILDNQYVHFKLAEFQTELECVRALYYRCIEGSLEGEDVTPLASMLKLKSCRLARQITDGCLQFWGGMGYTDDVIVSKLFRDLRLMSIGGGADEVMLQILCKYMGIAPGMR